MKMPKGGGPLGALAICRALASINRPSALATDACNFDVLAAGLDTLPSAARDRIELRT